MLNGDTNVNGNAIIYTTPGVVAFIANRTKESTAWRAEDVVTCTNIGLFVHEYG